MCPRSLATAPALPSGFSSVKNSSPVPISPARSFSGRYIAVTAVCANPFARSSVTVREKRLLPATGSIGFGSSRVSGRSLFP